MNGYYPPVSRPIQRPTFLPSRNKKDRGLSSGPPDYHWLPLIAGLVGSLKNAEVSTLRITQDGKFVAPCNGSGRLRSHFGGGNHIPVVVGEENPGYAIGLISGNRRNLPEKLCRAGTW